MATLPQPVFIKPIRQIIGMGVAGSGAGSQGVVNGVFTISTTTATQTTTLIADAVLEERGDDQMVITEQPVEQGAVISDHAYKLPSRLELTYGWSEGSPQNTTLDPSFLKNLYQQFLGLQVTRTLCKVYTGKRIYENMMIQAIQITTDKETENVLIVRLTMIEILIATTQQVNVPSAAVQAIPQKTAPTISQGGRTLQNAPNFNAINPAVPPPPP
ncbi:MAG TPA: hypothetical protein VND65_18235 [Candidatus Binatia bacterium]|nr:hypothetical protein [Candidatus Binatia bacterium]